MCRNDAPAYNAAGSESAGVPGAIGGVTVQQRNGNTETQAASRYFVREQDVPAYHPANHVGTSNRRLIGRENVGASHLEVILGEIQHGKGALPHAHPGIEQACYMLEGSAHVEVGGESFEMKAGEACFFPANMPHLVQVTSERARIMVMYSPPYEENPSRAVKHDKA